jgi:hypothetical protein
MEDLDDFVGYWETLFEIGFGSMMIGWKKFDSLTFDGRQ